MTGVCGASGVTDLTPFARELRGIKLSHRLTPVCKISWRSALRVLNVARPPRPCPYRHSNPSRGRLSHE